MNELMNMDTKMKKVKEEEEEEEDKNKVEAGVWDCGSPLYDSYELASMGHLLQKHTMLPFLSSFSTSKGHRLINIPDHPHRPYRHHQERFEFGSAKKKVSLNDVFYEKSHEEKGKEESEKLESFMEKRGYNVSLSSETETGISGIKIIRRNERVPIEVKANAINGFQRRKKKQVLVGEYVRVNEDINNLRQMSEPKMDQWNHGSNQYMGKNKIESVNSSIEDMTAQVHRLAGSLRSKARVDQNGVGKTKYEEFYRNNGSFPKHSRPPSNNESYYFHGHEQQMSNNYRANAPNGVEDLEKERAEIIRKLDELKEQISKSYQVVEKPVERKSMDYPYGNQTTYSNYSHRPPFMAQEYEDSIQPPMTRKLHTSPCSCIRCYNQNLRFPNKNMANSNFNHHEVHVTSRLQSHTPLQSLDPKLQAKSRRDFRPVAGGAPFIMCYKCFEVLKLPRKLRMRMRDGNAQRVWCGSCSTLIEIEIENKKLSTSNPKELKHNSSDSPVSSSFLSVKGTSSCSEDFSLVEDEGLNFDESEKIWGHSSPPSISSREEDNQDCMTAHVFEPIDMPSKDAFSPTPPSSPIEKESNTNSPKHNTTRNVWGNKSKRTFRNNMVFSRISSQNSSVKSGAEATELDVSFSEYQNQAMFQDSAELNNEDQLKFSKGSESFFVGLMKKSVGGMSRSSTHNGAVERPKVFINGQPISDSVVKRAEKMAGSIDPGDYWYDFKCGFWGVMGQPCLGIIPPFIEEFNHPMPTNCGAGNTRVYVNGRELHQRDLDLLSNKGLPTTKDMFYKIEISGRVFDEDSGEELEPLGKLAPTIERTKQGFGMRVPNVFL